MNIGTVHQKILYQMLEFIAMFKQEKIDLRTLIDNLEGLFNLLTNLVEDNFEKEFWQTWGVLEDEYSWALVSNQSKLNDESWADVVEAVIKLEMLIKGQIDSQKNE